MKTKYCNGCKQDKPLSEFNFRHSGRKAGKPRPRCKTCECDAGEAWRASLSAKGQELRRLDAIKRSREWREKNQERYLEMNRRYTQTHLKQRREYLLAWAHRTGRARPMSDAKETGGWLGVQVAEFVLSKLFKNVIRMPNNNPGYDFICNHGFKIDVKSSCRRVTQRQRPHWSFHINKNKAADFFLCLAFDDRESLSPLHLWLIPRCEVVDKTRLVITDAPEYLANWSKYERPIDKVVQCCNTLRESAKS